jgi:hypothetical protein
MPSVFTDATGNGYDLSITTSADWTVSTGGMPNGDNCVDGDGSIDATYNLNGDDFDLTDGTAWSIELWVRRSAGSGTEVILGNFDAGTTTEAWQAYVDTDNLIYVQITNTLGSAYLGPLSTALTVSTWHHIVIVKGTGASLTLYKDNVQISSDGSASGTARTPSSSYRIYLGSRGDGSRDLSNNDVAKLAIYNKELSLAEINDHYLAMVAT